MISSSLWVPLWFPRFKRTTPTLLEFGGNTLNSYNTEREAFWKDVLMPEKKQQTLSEVQPQGMFATNYLNFLDLELAVYF